jgi:hypothetical protein
MAADTGHGTDTGDMDMKEHMRTWSGFLSLVKWVLIFNFVLLLFLFIFRTHN